jgi:UDP-2,3-diacylglucosamine hydrolase
LQAGKKIYFASDFHLGAPNYEKSLEREKRIVRWLDMAGNDAEEIYLLGDVFDFWFEYRTVVPRGYVRLLGKIATLTDKGIKVHYFTGNHDMWTFNYLSTELNVKIYRSPVTAIYNEKSFYIGHGDGLGPGDHGYKFIKKIFSSRICQWLFARLHPNLGIGIANYFSAKSRAMTGASDEKFLGEEKEWLVQHSKEVLKDRHYDYLIFGHRHLPLDIRLDEKSRYINLGDWIKYNTYGVFDGKEFELKKYEGEEIK